MEDIKIIQEQKIKKELGAMVDKEDKLFGEVPVKTYIQYLTSGGYSLLISIIFFYASN